MASEQRRFGEEEQRVLDPKIGREDDGHACFQEIDT